MEPPLKFTLLLFASKRASIHVHKCLQAAKVMPLLLPPRPIDSQARCYRWIRFHCKRRGPSITLTGDEGGKGKIENQMRPLNRQMHQKIIEPGWLAAIHAEDDMQRQQQLVATKLLSAQGTVPVEAIVFIRS